MQAQRFLHLAAFTVAMITPLSSLASTEVFMNGQSIYGQPASNATAGRVFDLSTMSSLNVAYGDTVSFRGEGGKQFAWTFNGLDLRRVEVAKIAPAGFAAKAAVVHVGRNPVNRN